jgi:two-component system phosphate regulon sensor histidine kinase PhoR
MLASPPVIIRTDSSYSCYSWCLFVVREALLEWSMARRLTLWFGLLVLALLGGLALAVVTCVEPGDDRDRLLLFVALAAGVGVCGVVVVSVVLARQFRHPVRELVEAVGRVGEPGAAPRLVPVGDSQQVALAEAFNETSERLATRINRLEEDRQQLRTVLSGMVEGVVVLDAEQRVLFANDRAAELLEFKVASPVRRHLWEVVRHRPLLDAVRHAQQNAEPHREEVRWSGQTARSLTVHAARLPGHPPRGIVLVLHDTTELRRLERLRQDFVANVSHELKTPLSVIKVCVETLLDGAIEDAEHRGRFLEQISRQSDRLHALILDLLSLARIESGDELYDFRTVELDAVVQACIERHRPRAAARNQELLVTPPEQPVRAWADEEAVDQILENLLDNALKYTPDGGRIEVRWRRDDQAVVEVSDTGIGIPEADLPRIFERFYRVDRARSREMGGTGLGLSIVKHLAQAMHGSVRATSRLGEGTTFHVRLPLSA